MDKTAKWIVGIISIIVVIWLGYNLFNKETVSNEPIKIGSILPLSGKAVMFGDRSQKGILLAIEDLRKQGIDIEVTFEDEECLPAKAISAYRKLIDLDEIKIILGPLCSPSALAVAFQAEKDKVIMLSAGSAAPSLSYIGDYIFRNHTDVKQELKAQFNYLADNFDYKNIAIIYLKDNDYSVEGEKFLREELLPQLGMESVFSEGVLSDTDYRTVISKLKQLVNNIDLVLLDLLVKDDLNFLEEAEELGLNKAIVVSKVVNVPEFIDNIGSLGEGLIFAEADFTKRTNPDFWSRYTKKFNEDPTIFSAQSYESLILLAEIIENKCQSIDIDCIRDELYKTENWPGITGLLTVDKNGDFTKNVVVKIIKDGKIEILDQ